MPLHCLRLMPVSLRPLLQNDDKSLLSVAALHKSAMISLGRVQVILLSTCRPFHTYTRQPAGTSVDCLEKWSLPCFRGIVHDVRRHIWSILEFIMSEPDRPG